MAGTQAAFAQIIDDSTKVLYGPRTTLQLFERDVLEGTYREQRVDTAIHNMHNQRYWYQDTLFYQDLGNIGAAAKPLLFQLPSEIGARSGRYAFNRYAYDPLRINYFDTRSPYTHLHYVQGQRGEQVFEAQHARNISENWNVGVAYKLMAANRQVGPSRTLRGDRLVDGQAVKFYTHYRTKNEKYDLFANFTHLNHEQAEYGGYRPPSDTAKFKGYFPLGESENIFDSDFETVPIYLNQASSHEFRNNIHILQIYKLANEDLKLYHAFDTRRQEVRFQDNGIERIPNPSNSLDTIPSFYPETKHHLTLTDDRSFYRETQNEFGVTGNSKYSFFKGYLKYRNAKQEYSVLKFINKTTTSTLRHEFGINQLFLGGQLRMHYENKAMLQLDGEFQMTNDYKVSGLIYFEGLKFMLSRVLRSPSFTEQRLYSNHFEWDNSNFQSSVTDYIQASYVGKLGGRQYVKFKGYYTNIKRHIFFNEFNKGAQPEQLTGNQRIVGAQLEHRIRFGSLHFDNTVAYTNTDEAHTIRIPEWLLNSKLYFQGSLFKEALFGQFGVEMTMPSAYMADAYMPVAQQFYLQNNFMIPTYPVVDVFLNADIKTLNLFLKMSHVNDGLITPAYWSTPGYPNMRRSFIFGIKWMFFD